MGSEEFQIVVSGNQIRYIYRDDMADLMNSGDTTISRASHVEPQGNQWIADLTPVNGPILGPFTTRLEALQEEVKWLHEHNVPVPKGA